MGLDLTIRHQDNFKTDEKGRTTFTVTVLGNLRNCYEVLEKFSNRLESGFPNCATYSFHEGTFHAILKELKEELLDYEEGEFGRETLEYEIKQLEDFIKENNFVEQEPSEEEKAYGITEHYGDTYEVHAWW